MVFVNGVKGENKVYIEREEALRQIFFEAMGHNCDFNGEYKTYISAKRAIKNTPAADVVEVRHGRWVDEDGEIVCSKCGVRIPEMYSNADSIMQSECNFCHACGAKMDL